MRHVRYSIAVVLVLMASTLAGCSVPYTRTRADGVTVTEDVLVVYRCRWMGEIPGAFISHNAAGSQKRPRRQNRCM